MNLKHVVNGACYGWYICNSLLSFLELGKLAAFEENLKSSPNKWSASLGTIDRVVAKRKPGTDWLVDIDHCK